MHETRGLSRRSFLAATTAAVAGAALMRPAWADQAAKSRIWIVQGTDPARMLAKGMDAVGGWGQWVKPGATVALKPNAAWASLPEQGGNTDPRLVAACLAGLREAGAKRINMCENPCSPPERSFSMSGIGEVAKAAGANLYAPTERKHFREVAIPGGKVLKGADVAVDVLDCDCLINMPVAKSHGGARMTAAMKNWMGSVRDRGFWHRTDLHQCIADFSTFIRPALHIVDASRVMLTGGPRGPGRLAYPKQVVLGFDPVAVDAYLATLLNFTPTDIPYLKMGQAMGLGCADLDQVEQVRLEA